MGVSRDHVDRDLLGGVDDIEELSTLAELGADVVEVFLLLEEIVVSKQRFKKPEAGPT